MGYLALLKFGGNTSLGHQFQSQKSLELVGTLLVDLFKYMGL